MLTFEWIKPEDISNEWGLIKPGVEKVWEHGTHWLVEDVYMMLKMGQANLHIGYKNGDYVGFLILTPVKNVEGTALHIWAAYFSVRDLRKEVMMYLDKWANDMGADRITYQSTRHGWEKVAPLLGFDPVSTLYEREV